MSTVSRIAMAAASVITVLLLQATLIGPLTFPVPVSLPVLVVVVVGIHAGPGVGLGLGFATGLLADLGSDHPAGVLALCWMASGSVAGIVGGLATERGYATRGVAGMAAVLGAASSWLVAMMLAILGSHAASAWLAFRDVIPVGLVEALLGLIVVPVVRAMLRSQGIRTPRPVAGVIERPYATR
jgi:rod shape-determining protein MreD